MSEKLLDNVTAEEANHNVVNLFGQGQRDDLPRKGTKEWTVYVLSLLEPEELENGRPVVDGLRRVAEELIGEIVDIDTALQAHENTKFSVSTAKVTFVKDDGQVVSFAGTADATVQNTPSPFNEHLPASSDTKAEGRALRRALRLNRIICAEEKSPETADVVGVGNAGQVGDQQVVAIQAMATKYDINVVNLMEQEGLKKLDLNAATHLLSLLGQIGREESTDEKLIGYNNDWKALTS
jgi:hypothetical protein